MQSALAQNIQEQGAAIGGAVGAGAGALAALAEHAHVKDALNARATKQVEEILLSVKQELAVLKSKVGYQPIVGDFLTGMGWARSSVVNGESVGPPRAARLCSEDLDEGLAWPPVASLYDGARVLQRRGTLFRLGERLAMPETQAFFHAIQIEGTPGRAVLGQSFRGWRGLQSALSQTGVPAAQTDQAISALAAQIAARPLDDASIATAFQGLLSQAGQAAVLGLASTGPLTASQISALAIYFRNLAAGVSPSAGGAAAPSLVRGGLLAAITANSGTTITNTTTETAWADRFLTIPANSVPVGRILRLRIGVKIPSGNSTDTLTLRLKQGTNPSGSLLLAGPAIDPGNSGDVHFFECDIMRRPDVASAGRAQITGAVNGQAVQADEANLDWTQNINLVVTGAWSAASASDQAVLASFSAELV